MSTVDSYTAHALALIRVANGQGRDVTMQLNKLARDIRAMLLDLPLTSLRARRLKQVLRQVDEAIVSAYARILTDQLAFAGELAELEAAWAARQAGIAALPKDRITAMAANLTVLGVTLQDHWARHSMIARQRVAAEIRLGATAGQTGDQIAQRVVGSGSSMAGGTLDALRRDARGTVDATTQSVAGQARLEAMRSSGRGINAVKWFAILDSKVCPSCAERAEKLWDMDGKPIGHSIPFAQPVLHPWCRCILLPMKYPDGPPEDGGDVNKFGDWLNRQTRERQDDVLGVGRAQLWRDGKITTHDLIGQNGLVMTLRELRARLK